MTPLKSLLTAIIIFSGSFTYGNNGRETISKEISNRIKHSVIMPPSLKQKNAKHKVSVFFLVNEEGKVTEVLRLLKIRTLNAILKISL